MKIFISHSSDDAPLGNALVDLLRGVGIKENEITFTSNVAYGIPLGESIFDWLRNQIRNKPYVIYLLSNSYYSSVACLNEMGAAWVVENEHTIIFTPDFDLASPKFQNSALDPRELGFYIHNEERLISFIERLSISFEITSNLVLINQKIKEFFNLIAKHKSQIVTKSETKPFILIPDNHFAVEQEKKDIPILTSKIIGIDTSQQTSKSSGYYTQFLSDIFEGKLSNEEQLLIHYILDTSKVKLGTGWQEDSEIRNIIEWEDIKGLNNKLSSNYNSVIRRFELRKYTQVSAFTGSGNPKEVSLNGTIQEKILDFPKDLLSIIDKTVQYNMAAGLPF